MGGNSIAPRFSTDKVSKNDSFDDIDQLDSVIDGKSKPNAAEQASRSANADWALKLLKDFREQGGGSAFWTYDRATVANQLGARVRDPTIINQAQTWLCGVTSVVRAWAQDTPVDYAWLGIQLYNLGRGRMGKGDFLGKVLQPSDALRHSALPTDMVEADWIVLASCHEALNIGGVNDYTKDEGALHNKAWQYAREVAAAYRAAGYKNVIDHTDTTHITNFGVKDLEMANDCLRKGYRVSLLINDDLLIDKDMGSTSLHSNHWVGMLETINIMGDYVMAFKVFSWGNQGGRRIPQDTAQTRIRSTDFFKQFYGFVAARLY